jgi:hypothetical protein
MKICPQCAKQYADDLAACPIDREPLVRLACMADEYLGHFLAELPWGFEAAAELGPHTRSTSGDTPLHIAAIRGEVRAIELLLNAGAEIDASGENGFTPLHYAVEQVKLEAVRVLLARGASVEARNDFNETPRDIAELRNDQAIRALLHVNAT